MENNKINQEEIFTSFIALKNDIQRASSYIQNDFESCIEDGHFTKKESIKNMIPDMQKDFDSIIKNVSEYKEKFTKLMEHYAKE